MDVVHLNQKQLAARWHISEATLKRWHSEGFGPKFLKLCGWVIYRQIDIETYEESSLATSTKTVAAQVGWLRDVPFRRKILATVTVLDAPAKFKRPSTSDGRWVKWSFSGTTI